MKCFTASNDSFAEIVEVMVMRNKVADDLLKSTDQKMTAWAKKRKTSKNISRRL